MVSRVEKSASQEVRSEVSDDELVSSSASSSPLRTTTPPLDATTASATSIATSPEANPSPSPTNSASAGQEYLDNAPNEGSELPALMRSHRTDGYRAGITAGKAAEGTAQQGFDSGYPIGAALGMRVGYLRAAMAGVLSLATSKLQDSPQQGVDRLRGLKEQADVDLQLEPLLQELEHHLAVSDDNVAAEEQIATLLPSIDALDTIAKWNNLVKELGEQYNVDLTLK